MVKKTSTESNEKTKSSDNSKKYKKTGNSLRLKLLKMIHQENLSLRDAAEKLNINFYTAKTISRVYNLEQRVLKKTTLNKKVLIYFNFRKN